MKEGRKEGKTEERRSIILKLLKIKNLKTLKEDREENTLPTEEQR